MSPFFLLPRYSVGRHLVCHVYTLCGFSDSHASHGGALCVALWRSLELDHPIAKEEGAGRSHPDPNPH